jgi:hypothetical protein
MYPYGVTKNLSIFCGDSQLERVLSNNKYFRVTLMEVDTLHLKG